MAKLLDPNNEKVGHVLVSAVRYACGRQTYMPSIVVGVFGVFVMAIMNCARSGDKEIMKGNDNVKNTVTAKQISDMISDSEVHVSTIFDKVTVVSVRLPNGFVITESSGCVDPANYSEDMGREICMERITNKLWELEGYLLADKLAKEKDND